MHEQNMIELFCVMDCDANLAHTARSSVLMEHFLDEV